MSKRILLLVCVVAALAGCERKNEPLSLVGAWWQIEGSISDIATLAPLGGTHVSHRSPTTGYLTAMAISDSSGWYTITVPGATSGLNGDLEFDKAGYSIAVVHLPDRARISENGRYRLDVVLAR